MPQALFLRKLSLFFLGLGIFIAMPQQLLAQITTYGNFNGFVYGTIAAMPGTSGDDYANPDSTEYQDWKEMVNELLSDNYSNAEVLANSLNYDLLEFIDNPDTFYILTRKNIGQYWGTYAYRPSGCRKVVLQSPHPQKDFNTGEQSAYVFHASNARFFCLTGTNRCNHASFSSCAGTTSICTGSSEPYRISDVAHNDSSVFQATTEAIFEFDAQYTYIQLHGFAQQPGDPYLIMSNGTTITPYPDYIDSLKTELELLDDTLNFKIAHQDLGWTRLTGTTNTQGRYLNSSTDPCNASADTTYGYFIHIEQEKDRLRLDSTQWDMMATAIINVFECAGAPPGPVNDVEGRRDKIVHPYPNPFDQYLVLPAELGSGFQLFDRLGREVVFRNRSTLRLDTALLPEGFYWYRVEETGRIGSLVKVHSQ